MASTLSICLFVLSVISLQSVKSSSWNYNISDTEGPDNWEDTYADCGGNSQSPIDIDLAEVEEDDALENFSFDNYDVTSGVMVIVNNGHSAELSIEGTTMTLSGGGLPEDYIFAQLHFHWGSDDTTGSEHTVDGEHYPMEMHMVHYATQYGDLSSAAEEAEGLAVLGFFFEISSDGNDDLDDIITGVDDLTTLGTNATLMSFSMDSLYSAALGSYYRYNGSLTTPGCYESVLWTVFEDTIPISASQLSTFRALIDEDGNELVDNFRPVQSLNSRVISYYNADDNAATSSTASLVVMTITVALATVLQ